MLIDITNAQKLKVNIPNLRKLAAFVFQQEGIKDGYLSVALVDDKKIKELNRKYRRLNQSTDVLAFDLSEEERFTLLNNFAKGEIPQEADLTGLIGDIALSVETAGRKARELKHRLEDELFLYLAHGILHLSGYDDTNRKEYLRMKERQEEIIRKFRNV